MNVRLQTTIMNPISCYGIGVHSGRKVQVTLKPAKADTGILFIRTDISGVNNKILALYNNVTDTQLCTTISNGAKVNISTIEHLMAALSGCFVDNLIIEINGPEVPIMDGSSRPFVFMIECAGIKYLNIKSKSIKLLKEVFVSEKDSTIYAIPDDDNKIDLTINFNNKLIGKQRLSFSDQSLFKDDIAPSRTFGFLSEFDYLKSRGLANGASLDNTIGIDNKNDVIMNHEGLRYSDEFVRHKILDFIGDMFTSGGKIIGNFVAYKTSHSLNNQLIRNIFNDPNNYRFV